jgi:hypothetical protein
MQFPSSMSIGYERVAEFNRSSQFCYFGRAHKVGVVCEVGPVGQQQLQVTEEACLLAHCVLEVGGCMMTTVMMMMPR